MASRILAKLRAARNATARKALKYRIAAKQKQKRYAKKQQDAELIREWRALKKVGLYSSKDNPALKNLTESRRKDIKKKFQSLQSLSSYEQGEAYEPLHLQTLKSKSGKEYKRYDLDTDHFQLLKGKPTETIPDSLKTSKGILAAKNSNQKLRIDKKGNLEIVEKYPEGSTSFGRIPLSGPIDFIKFIDDAKNGRIKLKSNEAIQLLNNGHKIKGDLYVRQDGMMRLVARLERYISGGLFRPRGGQSNFDDWASKSGLLKVRYR